MSQGCLDQKVLPVLPGGIGWPGKGSPQVGQELDQEADLFAQAEELFSLGGGLPGQEGSALQGSAKAGSCFLAGPDSPGRA
jgi:hypothetical protein